MSTRHEENIKTIIENYDATLIISVIITCNFWSLLEVGYLKKKGIIVGNDFGKNN